MFKKLVKHITEGNSYFGLEIFEVNGKEYFTLLQMNLKKGELEVELEKTSDRLEELLEYINAKAPLFLTLNTSKVLKKEVSQEVQTNHELSVINAFPNLELDNFYYQLMNSEHTGIVAISKKEYVDWYIEQLSKIGINPISLSLGIAPIKNISSFFKGRITGSNFNAQIEDGNISGLELESQLENETIDLDGISLHKNSLLGFSSIIGHLQQLLQNNNLQSMNSKLKNDLYNSRVFDFGIKFALLFFLVVLLGNFLIFSSYNSKNQSLESTLLVDGQNDQALKNVKERVLAKEERVKTLANSKNSKTSFYLDEIAKGLPKSIWLSDMRFQPLLFPVRNDKPIEFNSGSLEISGIINDKIAFTVWSDNLEMQKWVNKVEIIDYEYISSSSANFTVNIVLNEVQ